MCNYSVKDLSAKLQTVAACFICFKGEAATPFHLLEAISRNGLFYFLLANVLTGVVNLLVATISASTTMAMFILIFYMLVLSAVTALLHFYNITIKFW